MNTLNNISVPDIGVVGVFRTPLASFNAFIPWRYPTVVNPHRKFDRLSRLSHFVALVGFYQTSIYIVVNPER